MQRSTADISKHDHISNTLKALQSVRRDDIQHRAFDRYLDKLSYTAPELMDSIWLEIHNYLSEEAPGDAPLQLIWNSASTLYNEICAAEGNVSTL